MPTYCRIDSTDVIENDYTFFLDSNKLLLNVTFNQETGHRQSKNLIYVVFNVSI
jgi:hypothetical protein